MNLREFRENLELHEKGAPIKIGVSTFYIKRLGNAEANKIMKKISLSLFGPLHKHSEEDLNLKIAHMLADYACVGWENVYCECPETDPEFTEEFYGKPFPYSQDNAREIFLNEQFFGSLNIKLWNAGWEFENYLYEDMEESLEAIKKL